MHRTTPTGTDERGIARGQVEDCRDPQPPARCSTLTEAEHQKLFEEAKARATKNHRANLDWLAQH